MLESVPWQEGYYSGIFFGYDSRDEEHHYQGQEACRLGKIPGRTTSAARRQFQ